MAHGFVSEPILSSDMVPDDDFRIQPQPQPITSTSTSTAVPGPSRIGSSGSLEGLGAAAGPFDAIPDTTSDPHPLAAPGSPNDSLFAASTTAQAPIPAGRSTSQAEGNMDLLVHKLSRQSLAQQSRRPPTSESSRLHDWPGTVTAQAPAPIQPQYWESPSSGSERTSALSAPLHLRPDPAEKLADDELLRKCRDARRRKLLACTQSSRSSSSSFRAMHLVTEMVERGVQCNVQESVPSSPSDSAVMPSSNSIETARGPEPSDAEMTMDLELDMGFSEQDTETLLRDNLMLRNAGTPVGIRKFGYLRYRSSTEAALACKNWKRSAPRMRRRRKVDALSSSTPQSSTMAV
ncbi:hypothetical protein F4780DRAFT_783140 [Xylariomycetidae sp. FL0641]|nr:hypothetical protein F4780DRAFT_783140 [Xylariomycetidae sp. FL0641]